MKLKVSVRQLVEACAKHLGAVATLGHGTEVKDGTRGPIALVQEVEFETDDITKVLRFIRKAEK